MPLSDEFVQSHLPQIISKLGAAVCMHTSREEIGAIDASATIGTPDGEIYKLTLNLEPADENDPVTMIAREAMASEGMTERSKPEPEPEPFSDMDALFKALFRPARH